MHFPLNQFYDCNGDCNNDADGDGICDEFEIPGCMDDAAINYNPYATEDDGTCMVLTGGCVIPFACNYDPNADFYDGSCDFDCLYGTAEMGCNHEMACNYGASDEPCLFFNAEGQTCIPGGCLMESACNYDSDAVYSDGSCDFDSCITSGAPSSRRATSPTGQHERRVLRLRSHTSAWCRVAPTRSLAISKTWRTTTTARASLCLAWRRDAPCPMRATTTPTRRSRRNVRSLRRAWIATVHVFRTPTPTACVTFRSVWLHRRARSISTPTPRRTTACAYANGGCTDAFACNFDHLANENDGSCEYGCLGCMSIHACNFNLEATLPTPKNASSCLIWKSWARRPSPQGTRRFTRRLAQLEPRCTGSPRRSGRRSAHRICHSGLDGRPRID